VLHASPLPVTIVRARPAADADRADDEANAGDPDGGA
jgi:hypothetical protein